MCYKRYDPALMYKSLNTKSALIVVNVCHCLLFTVYAISCIASITWFIVRYKHAKYIIVVWLTTHCYCLHNYRQFLIMLSVLYWSHCLECTFVLSISTDLFYLISWNTIIYTSHQRQWSYVIHLNKFPSVSRNQICIIVCWFHLN